MGHPDYSDIFSKQFALHSHVQDIHSLHQTWKQHPFQKIQGKNKELQTVMQTQSYSLPLKD